ncbi:MAG: hypothetical protein HZB16_00435 [Armatimonadetes bacterium]|nr:hypothetical protein [Armatimonadota bacterium]
MNTTTPAITERESLLCAAVLTWGSRVALVLMVASYAAYLLGVGTPRVSPAAAQANWHRSHSAFAAATAMPQGWAFLGELHHSDMLAMSGLCLVPVAALVAVAALVPGCLRRREWLFGAVCAALVGLVLVTALVVG